ncbi:MAG: methyltransferase [Salegentibacter sp.]
MSTQPFQFKEFTVHQDRCAMKIGTDGVLLGAWTPLDQTPDSILDIGAGTGVLALMMAQRSDAMLIDALEIDEDAYEQAVENFERSEWGDRLFCYHAAFDEFVEEMQDEQKYELIISNPPFYSSEFTSENDQRNQARFAEALPFDELLNGVSKLLSAEGIFSLIIPYSEEEKLLKLAAEIRLFPKKITRVKGHKDAEIKRSLLNLSFSEAIPEIDELVLEISRHHYTKEYRDLVSAFYLKL